MSRVDMTDQQRDELAGEYVLGTLDASQGQWVAQHVQTDAALAAAVRAWERKLLPLTGLVEPVTPPPRLWMRITRTLQWTEAGEPRRSWWSLLWNSLLLWRGLTTGALVAVCVMASVLLVQTPGSAPRFMVVLVAPQDKAPGWIIQAGTERQVSLIPLGSFEVPPGKALEFWTKADDWSGPVSLGLIKPGQRAQIPLDKLPPLQPNQLFELTLEPSTGSPIGRPTGPIQFIGRAVPVV